MKNKNNKIPKVEVQEMDGLSAIRDILMGQHIAEFKATIDAFEQEIGSSSNNFAVELKALEKKMDDRMNTLEKSMNLQFAKVEKLLAENIDKLNNRIDQVSTADKKNLASMLASLSQNLAKGDF